MEFDWELNQEGGLRILAVEDHSDVRKALKALLDMLGHETVFATDMQSALQLAESGGHFDVLLSDIGLPDGDGWELIRRLRRSGQCPPAAVAMSCMNSPADIARSETMGFSAYLGKPFTPDELEAALSAAVHHEQPH